MIFDFPIVGFVVALIAWPPLLRLLEQLAEHREDIAAVGNLAHRHALVVSAHQLIGPPQRGRLAPAIVLGVADFQIGVVLHKRQDRLFSKAIVFWLSIGRLSPSEACAA
jgi:hypothetical protein